MSNIKVSQKILLWAINRRGLTIAEVKKKFPKFDDWMNGVANPSIRQIENLARMTSTPFGYFFLQDPPEIVLAIPHFRTTDDGKPKAASPELIETVQAMELRQEWVKEFLTKRGVEPRSYVGSVGLRENIQNAAKKIKEELALSDHWSANCATFSDAHKVLRNSMEDIGILVVVNGIVGNNTSRALDPNEFRGFVLSDPLAPLVFINGADSKGAQMFTLAHELAHIFVGKSAAFDLKEMQPAADPSERLCNAIAAEILVPQDQLTKLWKVHEKNNPYQMLARLFKVSNLVVARRALDLRLITKDDFFDFYNLYLTEWAKHKAKIKKNSTGGDFYASQNLKVGRSFADFVVSAVREGSILYSEAYRLTGLSGSSFDKFVSSRRLKKTGSD